MPTDLPIGFSSLHARSVARHETDGIRDFFQTLLLFYLGVAGFALMLMAAEYQFGAFKGLTVAEVALKATGVQFTEQFDTAWLPSGP